MAPYLGWIHPNDRTQEQMDAHEAAVKRMPQFSIPGGLRTLAKGEKVVLYDFLDKPECVNDIGFLFPWFHQNTGSCVGASLGNASACLSGVQRFNPDRPTKAMLPFWPYAYAMARTDGGSRGRGDGAMCSVAAERAKQGILPVSEAHDVPQYQNDEEGLQLDSNTEYDWSIATSQVRAYESIAAKFPFGTAAVARSTDDLIQGIINGYPGWGGCSMYIGSGSLRGAGKNACVMGKFDNSGGHATGFYGYWNHPDFGDLLLYCNNWSLRTYPKDPSIQTYRCHVWAPRSEVDKIFTRYDGMGEYFSLSHLEYFPAQPWVLNWDM